VYCRQLYKVGGYVATRIDDRIQAEVGLLLCETPP
jgi:hypothetical protein